MTTDAGALAESGAAAPSAPSEGVPSVRDILAIIKEGGGS